MTATEVKSPERRTRKRGATIIPEVPQVNLLPPEVVAARGLRVLKRWLGLLIALVVVACAAGVGVSLMAERAAEDELAQAQAETTRLQAEREQYVEVPLVLGEVDRVTAARMFGMSTEVELAKYLAAISATAPDGVSIDTLQASITPPTTEPVGPADPLAGPTVGQLTFEAESLTVPDTANWVDALNAIPGLADAWFTAADITEVNGTVYYTVSATVQVTSDAYAKRFEEEN